MGTGTETKKDGSTDKGQLKLEFVVEYYCAADEGNRIKNAVVFDSHDLSNENAFGDWQVYVVDLFNFSKNWENFDRLRQRSTSQHHVNSVVEFPYSWMALHEISRFIEVILSSCSDEVRASLVLIPSPE